MDPRLQKKIQETSAKLEALIGERDWKGIGAVLDEPDVQFRAQTPLAGKVRVVERPDAEGNPMEVIQRQAYISSETIDSYGEIVEAQALVEAWPGYMRFPTVRAMHDWGAAGPVGTIYEQDVKITKKGILVWISVPLTETETVNKIRAGLYRALSIGFSHAEYEWKWNEDGSLKELRITGLRLIEISLVDVPANDRTGFKAACATVQRLIGEETGREVPDLVVEIKTEKEAEEVLGILTRAAQKVRSLLGRNNPRAEEARQTVPEEDQEDTMDAKAIEALLTRAVDGVAEKIGPQIQEAQGKAVATETGLGELTTLVEKLVTDAQERGEKTDAAISALTAEITALKERSAGSAQIPAAELDAMAQDAVAELDQAKGPQPTSFRAAMRGAVTHGKPDLTGVKMGGRR